MGMLFVQDKNSTTGSHDGRTTRYRSRIYRIQKEPVVAEGFALVEHNNSHDSTSRNKEHAQLYRSGADGTHAPETCRNLAILPVSVGGLKSVLDLLQKSEGYPSSAVFIRHAQKSETIVHSVMKHMPIFFTTGGTRFFGERSDKAGNT